MDLNYQILIWHLPYRSHQSQSEMWFKPTSKLFILPVFSILGNNSTIHQDGQARTLGVTLHTYFSSHRFCHINHQILSITPPQYMSCIHLLLSISCYLLPQSQLPSFLFYLSTVYSLAQVTIKYYRLSGLKKQKFIEFPEIYISPRSR